MIFDIFRRDLTVKRIGIGDYQKVDDGPALWVDGAETSFTIKASVQGADNEVLQTLPEGDRTKEVYVLYTTTELKTVVTGLSNPDIVVIDNKEYQVIRVTSRRNLSTYATAHYEIIVIKIIRAA